MVKILLKFGAKVDMDGLYEKPRIIALKKGNLKILELLLNSAAK